MPHGAQHQKQISNFFGQIQPHVSLVHMQSQRRSMKDIILHPNTVPTMGRDLSRSGASLYLEAQLCVIVAGKERLPPLEPIADICLSETEYCWVLMHVEA